MAAAQQPFFVERYILFYNKKIFEIDYPRGSASAE